jgi:hypothetical protein
MAFKKPSKITVVNPNTAGVIYDKEGRSIGGGEAIELDELDEIGQSAVDSGQLFIRESE